MSSKILSNITAFACGAAIWVLSPRYTGHVEPWDASGLYYWATLFVSGLVATLIEPKQFKVAPLWIVAGQGAAILGGIIFGDRDAGLLPLGILVLFLFSVLCYAGAFLGTVLRKIHK